MLDCLTKWLLADKLAGRRNPDAAYEIRYNADPDCRDGHDIDHYRAERCAVAHIDECQWNHRTRGANRTRRTSDPADAIDRIDDMGRSRCLRFPTRTNCGACPGDTSPVVRHKGRFDVFDDGYAAVGGDRIGWRLPATSSAGSASAQGRGGADLPLRSPRERGISDRDEAPPHRVGTWPYLAEGFQQVIEFAAGVSRRLHGIG
jgi:hypothetical protein